MISNLLALLTGVGFGIFIGVVLDSAIKSTNFSGIQIARLALAIAILLSGVSYYKNVSCQAEYNNDTAMSLATTRKVQIATLDAQISLSKSALEPNNPATIAERKRYTAQAQELLNTYAQSPLGPSKC